ncbi:MAG: hypothetical protein ACP5MD_05695 [Verrucomicrobiia bacterium]
MSYRMATWKPIPSAMFGLHLLCAGAYVLWPLCATCTAEPRIEANRLLDHVRVLSSDEFEGRAPGTVGETKTVEYIIRQFKELGLEPGNPNGTYVQDVLMVGITGEAKGFYRSGGKLT